MRIANSLLLVILGVAACGSGVEISQSPPPSATAPQTATPSPAPTLTTTAVPSATPSPMLTASGELRLEEDFSGEISCMNVFDRPEYAGWLADGGYWLEVRQPNQISLTRCETLVIGDFSLEVDVGLASIPENSDYYYGLIFRISGEEYYGFVLGSLENYCAFYGVSDQNFVHLTNSTDFEAPCWVSLPAGALAADQQHLRVLVVDDRIDLYLNGELIAVLRDSKLERGWIGFTAGTTAEGGLRLNFDNLRVTEP